MRDLNEVALELVLNATVNCFVDTEAVLNIKTPWGKILQVQISVVDSNESEFNDYSGIPTENFNDLIL